MAYVPPRKPYVVRHDTWSCEPWNQCGRRGCTCSCHSAPPPPDMDSSDEEIYQSNQPETKDLFEQEESRVGGGDELRSNPAEVGKKSTGG